MKYDDYQIKTMAEPETTNPQDKEFWQNKVHWENDWNKTQRAIESIYQPNGTDELILDTNKINMRYIPSELVTTTQLNQAGVVKSVTQGNGLSLNNGNLSMAKQWATPAEVASNVPSATTTTEGKIRIATQAEVTNGISDNTVVTPATLKQIIQTINPKLNYKDFP